MITIHIYDFTGLDKKTIKKKSKKLLSINLARYLDVKIDKVKLKYNKNGKPQTDGVFFSISHSKGKLIQVFTKQEKIGIDVEYKNPKRKYRKLAKKYFHRNEHNYLQTLNPTAATNGFYRLWTSKEAVCKAEGGRLWYYLADNYLDNENKMLKIFNGLNLTQLDIIDGFSTTIASSCEYKKVKVLYE